MAMSTWYPGCNAEPVKRYAWNSEATCIQGCKKEICLCVEPEITCIKPGSFVTLNKDGIAVMLTMDLIAEMECCSEVFFSTCCYNPKEPGKQRWFWYDIKVSGHCICWEDMGATSKEDIAKLSRIAARNGIMITWPHIN